MKTQPLRQLATIFLGVAPSGADACAKAFFIQIKDLRFERRALVRASVPTVKRAMPASKGDVLLGARGDQALAVPVDEGLLGAYPSLDVYLIRPDGRRLDAGYLIAYLCLPSTSAQLKASTAGSLVPRIPKKALDELQVPLPPLPRQRQIGAFAEAVRAEQALLTRLDISRTQLRERQLAAVFAAEF